VAQRVTERPVVVQKRGNARGAKGPYWKHDSVRRGENRLDENPVTETRAAAGKAMPETVKEPGVPGKARFAGPFRISQLRQKLGQKAKQEPRFRFYVLYDRIPDCGSVPDIGWMCWKRPGNGCDGIRERPGWMASPSSRS